MLWHGLREKMEKVMNSAFYLGQRDLSCENSQFYEMVWQPLHSLQHQAQQ
jgi:hypothetical protein